MTTSDPSQETQYAKTEVDSVGSCSDTCTDHHSTESGKHLSACSFYAHRIAPSSIVEHYTWSRICIGLVGQYILANEVLAIPGIKSQTGAIAKPLVDPAVVSYSDQSVGCRVNKMDFVAIDFETANGQPHSACQLAAVVVENGQVVNEMSWLVRPPRMYFSPHNIAIHGIRPQDVMDAATMEGVWPEFKELVGSHVLLAHNAGFDMRVLIHSLSAFDIACHPFEYSCTRLLSRAAWPGRRRYGLKALADSLGIQFKHHDALEDSRCCAHIALAVAKTVQVDSLEALEEKLNTSRGRYHHSLLQGPRSRSKRNAQTLQLRSQSDRWGFPNQNPSIRSPSVDAERVAQVAGSSKPLAGRTLVLLGPLRGLNMQASIKLLEDLGAKCSSEISAETHYVVACGTTLAEANQVVLEQTSRPSQGRDTPIRILSERQLYALLPGGQAALNW